MMRAETRSFSSFPFVNMRLIVFSAIYALFFGYLAFHTFNGERGLYALLRENRKLELLKDDYAQIHAQRENLERDVKLLRADSLDLDMLDEQARAQLGQAGADEVMVLDGKKSAR